MIRCYTVPEIRHVTDVIVVIHFGQFLVLLPHKQPKKIKFQKTEKKPWRYHHFTQVYQNSWSYAILFLRYGADGCNCYFSFWAIFRPFTLQTDWKMKISKKKMKKKKKNSWRYHHFTQVYQKSWLYATFLEIWRITDVIAVFHFRQFFYFLPQHKKSKFRKNQQKNPLKQRCK